MPMASRRADCHARFEGGGAFNRNKPRRPGFPCHTDTLRRRCLTGKDDSFWLSRKRPDERIAIQQFRWFNAERQISWQPRNKVEVSRADRATSQTILKGRVRRAKKAVSIRMAVVRNKADLIPGDLPTRVDRRVRQADPAAAPATLQTTRRRPARRERKAVNNPTPVNSAFRVVRAGPAPSGPALFTSERCAPRRLGASRHRIRLPNQCIKSLIFN